MPTLKGRDKFHFLGGRTEGGVWVVYGAILVIRKCYIAAFDYQELTLAVFSMGKDVFVGR